MHSWLEEFQASVFSPLVPSLFILMQLADRYAFGVRAGRLGTGFRVWASGSGAGLNLGFGLGLSVCLCVCLVLSLALALTLSVAATPTHAYASTSFLTP